MPAKWWATSPAARRAWNRHRRRFGQGVHHEWPIRQRDNFRSEDTAKIGEPAAGKNPDAVCYEPKTKRVFAINHTGGDATSIDAKTRRSSEDFPIGAGRRVLPSGWRGQSLCQHRKLERSGGNRRGEERSYATNFDSARAKGRAASRSTSKTRSCFRSATE